MLERLEPNKGWVKKPKKSNQSKNQTENETTNRLTETNNSVLVFVLHKSRFRFIKYKNLGFS